MNRFVRWMTVLITLGGGSVAALGQTGTVQGYCDQGGVSAMVSGLPSTNKLQGNIPSCTITVYLTGTQTKATIFRDGSSTALSNPFTADALGSLLPGHFIFWAATGQALDVTGKGGITPNVYPQTVPLLTDVFPGAVGGGGTGCTLGGVAANAVLANHGGACFGDQFFTYNFGTVDVNGGATLQLETGSEEIVYGVNDPTHNNWILNGTDLTQRSNGANGIGGIQLFLDDGNFTSGGAGGPIPYFATYSEGIAGHSSIGINLIASVGGVAAARVTGAEFDAPVMNAGSSADKVWGFYANMGSTSLVTTEQFGFLAETSPSVTINSNYCDFMGRIQAGGAVRETIGCGPTFANTFNGPTTFQNITINGTCTGTGCGGGGGSGTVTSFAAPSGSWPAWLVPTVTNAPTTPSLAVAASAIPNAALANSSTTVNGVTCTLGSTCTVSGGSSGISGLTAGFIPLAGSATTLTANSHLNDGITTAATITSTEPFAVNDGTGKAGAFGLLAGTAPGAAPANTVQINAPAAVTAYAINLPGAQPTAGNTRLDCTAANPSICSWAAAGGSSGFPIVLGSTSIAASSTTTAVTGLSVNGVTLNAAGSTSLFLNQAGGYTTPSSGGSSIVASAEVVTFSATPTFSVAFNTSRIVLTASITSFTLGAGADGQDKKLCFKQGAGPFTVTPPANVHGFFAVGTTNATWSCQSFNYDNTDSIWLAMSDGVQNQ